MLQTKKSAQMPQLKKNPQSLKTKKNPNVVDIEVGRRIRARRLMLSMSQEKLAGALGLTFQQVQKYEKGVNRIGAGRLQRVAELLDVPVSYFFGASDQGDPETREIMGLVDTAGALRLLRAFSRLKDRKVRQALVNFAEEMAVAQRW